MALLENSLLIIGVAMCVLALLPLAFWSAQSWATLRHNRVQFRESQQLLRQQILATNAQRTASTQTTQSSDAATVSVRSTTQVQQTSANEATPQGVVGARSAATKNTRRAVQADGDWKGFRQFRVENLVKETANCTSAYLVPVDGKPIANFKAGQHLTLRFQIPSQPKPVIRCYSLSDGPGKSHYRISVKAVAPGQPDQEPGLVSNFINDQLQLGDVVEAKSPAGSFWLDLNDSRPAVLLAGGIGVTPMISMIDLVLAQSPNRVVVLFYGVRNKADQAFAGYLRRMQKANQNFHVVHCFSNPGPDDVLGSDSHIKGHVSIDLLKQLLPGPDCQFYLCGPSRFMQTLGTALKKWGVDDNQVHSEAFGPASIAKAPSVTSAAEVGSIEVAVDQADQTVPWDPNCESLLELAEQHDVDIDSGCRAGSCGTCATTLLAGEVQYPQDLQMDCEPGQCLICVAKPVSSVKLGAQP